MSEGAFVIYGVILGAGLTWAHSGFRSYLSRKSRGRYLAFRVVIAIDVFVDGCLDAISSEPHPLAYETDPDTFAPVPAEYREPEGVDWASIDNRLAYELLSIPVRERDARIQLESLAEFTTDIRSTRDELFKRLALDADALATRLRRKHNVPTRDQDGWRSPESLQQWRAEDTGGRGHHQR